MIVSFENWEGVAIVCLVWLLGAVCGYARGLDILRRKIGRLSVSERRIIADCLKDGA